MHAIQSCGATFALPMQAVIFPFPSPIILSSFGSPFTRFTRTTMAAAPYHTSSLSDVDGNQYIVVLVPTSLPRGPSACALRAVARPPSPRSFMSAGGGRGEHAPGSLPLHDDTAAEAFMAVGGVSGLLSRATARTRSVVRFGRDIFERVVVAMGTGGAQIHANAANQSAEGETKSKGAAVELDTAPVTAAALTASVAAADALMLAVATASTAAATTSAGAATAAAAGSPNVGEEAIAATGAATSVAPAAAHGNKTAGDTGIGAADATAVVGSGGVATAVSPAAETDGGRGAALAPARAMSTSPVTSAEADVMDAPGQAVANTRREWSNLSRINARRWAANQPRSGSGSAGSHSSCYAPRRPGRAPRSRSDGAALGFHVAGAPPSGGSVGNGRLGHRVSRNNFDGAGSSRAAVATIAPMARRGGAAALDVTIPKVRVPQCRRRVSFEDDSRRGGAEGE